MYFSYIQKLIILSRKEGKNVKSDLKWQSSVYRAGRNNSCPIRGHATFFEVIIGGYGLEIQQEGFRFPCEGKFTIEIKDSVLPDCPSVLNN